MKLLLALGVRCWSWWCRDRKPFIVVVVTGKGPQKEHYEERIRASALGHIGICTMWLEASDYPRFMGCADLGVCLHTSTSGTLE
jgi:beta-1,4-mannosyltransferase